MHVLQLDHLSKRFGDVVAVHDLSLRIPEHSVFGFIGKNGAGKTTTMKMVLGFLRPSSGQISVCGERVTYGNSRTNRLIGYLPDVPEFYGYMTASEYLQFCGRIGGLTASNLDKRIGELLQLVGLTAPGRRVHGFSRGMRQRLGIAQALLNEPRLLICDEPTSALDPVGRKEILEIISAVRERTTVLFSTHILTDVERVCDQIAVLDQGKLLLQGSLSDIRGTYRQDALHIELADASRAERLTERLRTLAGVTGVFAEGCSFTVHCAGLPRPERVLMELLLREQIAIRKLEVLEPSLEHVFMELVK